MSNRPGVARYRFILQSVLFAPLRITQAARNALRRQNPWLLTGAVGAAAMIVAVACSSGGGEGSRVGNATDCGSAPSDEVVSFDGTIVSAEDVLAKDEDVTRMAVVEWGLMFEQSGPLEGFGDPSGDGVKLAVQEINKAGGFQVGDTIYTINLIERDTASDVSKSVAIATELVKDDGVCIILGPASIADAEVIQITQPQGVLNMCPCPGRETTALVDVDEMRANAPFAFQTLSAPSKFLPPGAANTRAEHPEFETFATICSNTQIGRSFCGFFRESYSDAGFEHVAEEFVPEGTLDFSPFLTNLKGTADGDDPDIILNFVDAGVAQFALLRQSCELDLGEFYIAVELPLDLFNALVACDGIEDKIVSAGAAPRGHAIYTSDEARDFFEDLYRPFEGGTLDPGAFVAMTMYDPVFMLVAAMQMAGTVEDTTKITEALEQIHYSGVSEEDLFFDERHVIVTGNDNCTIFQGEMECTHFPAVR